jgi:hypothetical protein
MILQAWKDGFGRVAGAPAVLASLFALTFLAAVPAAVIVRSQLESHLGRSTMAHETAEGVNYDWWQEFSSQASGLGSTFSTSIIGFAASLDNLASVIDAQPEVMPLVFVLAAYMTIWLFLSGGIIDRYARQRPTRAHGFFAISGVFFFRFLRMGAFAGLAYWFLFGNVHGWLLTDLHTRVTRDLDAEPPAILWRLALYALFGALVLAANVVIDFAKIRMVVEDRRSATGALLASCGFIRRHPGRVLGLYAANSATFVALLAVWWALAPGAGGAGASMWMAFAAGQLFVLARVVLKLQFIASETALFQASLAHARYTAVAEPVWPESPAAELIVHGN